MQTKNPPAATWTPPRTPRNWTGLGASFRRSQRAAIELAGRLVDPGHPGSATFEVLDIGPGGVFLADDDATIGHDATVRIGLPLGSDERARLWTWAQVRWRGHKHGRRGVGLRLRFEDEDHRRCWRRTVAAWMHARLAKRAR